ncbi:MAG: hypothetical protein JSW56_07865, partial [Deltaproteobacteria bacterium]
VYILRDQPMKGETEKVHTWGQAIWVKGWIDGRTIFCIRPPGERIWVEHCPKCGERLSLEDLRDGDEWKWD